MAVNELPAHQVFKDFIDANGLTKDGQKTKNPWKYDPLPEPIKNAPVIGYIFNISPIRQTVCMGSLGTRYLFPRTATRKYGKPFEVRQYVVDWADQGNYEHKPIILNGEEMAREMINPGGDKDNDLRSWGVFYSKTNPPSDAEIAQAQARLEGTWDALLKRADRLYETPAKRDQITDIYKLAAKEMKAARPWCMISRAMDACPACLQSVEKGVSKCPHANCNAILDWKQALKFRQVTKAEFEEAVEDGLVPGVKPKKIAEAK